MTSVRLDRIRLTACAALLGAAGAPAQLPGPLPIQELGQELGQEPDDPTPRAFQVYDSPAVRDRVQSATEHLEGQRWSEALVDLQGLLEEHRGQVLPPTRPQLPTGRSASVHGVFGGASEWATRTLAGLPEEAKDLYRSRHGARAQRALQAALAGADRAGLARVARRFPLTEQALRAWLALGDLEVERGDLEVGAAAWARGLGGALEQELDPTRAADWRGALAALEDSGRPGLLAAARPRVAAALAHLSGEGELSALAERGRYGTALEPGGDLGRIGRDPDSWPRRFDLPTPPDSAANPFCIPVGEHSLFPARRGDSLYVSTTRALFAVGAYTGEELWRTDENFLGWEDVSSYRIDGYSQAIDYENALVRPAVDRGTVVAALQVPFIFEDEDNYGDLQIIKIIPERRLFAFDADSGEPLWDTRPPSDWDGESGEFAQRTTVVGSPVIAGTRVLVTTARLRGRIELFVACFDLHTGELSWSTPVLTGQRPLNMFGRLVEEFVAPPVVVAGDRLVVQTQLGTVACLDLFTGDALWHALYDNIVFTAGSYYRPGQLNSDWRNAPPAVVGEVVVAAPMDSSELLGIDLRTGAVLWAASHEELSDLARGGGVRLNVLDVLLGADERRVFLGSRKVVALEAPGGLAAGPPRRRAWVFPTESGSRVDPGSPRAVLGDDRVYVPQHDGLTVLDRRTGKRQEEMAWQSSSTRRGDGNLLVSEGTLFTLSGYGLKGYFEWDAMVRRARAALAKAPDDPRRIEDLAVLQYKRGLGALAAGDYRQARRFLEDARSELGTWPDQHPSLRAPLHRVLRAEARNLRLAADSQEALRRLREARPLAPDRAARRDTLLEEQAILLERDFDAWLEVAGLLEQEFPREPVPFLAQQEEGESAGWRGAIQPEVAALSLPPSGVERRVLPLGLWLLVERAQGYARRRQLGDEARELEDLHAILESYATLELPGEVQAWTWAAARVGARVAAGAEEAYAPFEERARNLLDRARAAGDARLLERVPALFPHSRAAGAANDARVELALETGDASQVAEIVLATLPADWAPRRASAREVAYLVRFAHLLGEQGNLELRGGLIARLAEHHPELEVPIAGLSETRLADLAGTWAWTPPEAPGEPTFGHDLRTVRAASSLDDFEPCGVIPPGPGQAGVVQLASDGSKVLAFGDGVGDPAAPLLWEFDAEVAGRLVGEPLPSNPTSAVATTVGRAHVVTLEHLRTFDRESGELLWKWRSPTRSLVAVEAADGVVVAVEDLGEQVYRLVALDAAVGVELWEIGLLGTRFSPRPVLGEGHLVLLPMTASQAQVIDLYTGSGVASFELAFIPHRTRSACWIEHGRIILPYFLQGQSEDLNHVLAHELTTGRLAWRVPLSGGPEGPRELSEVLTHGDRHFLNLWPVPVQGGRERNTDIGIYELDTRLGALATQPVATLPESAESIGVRPYQHTYLTSPYLFVLCTPRAGTEPRFSVRAIHLRWGDRWQVNLPREFQRTVASDLPQPAVSETTVALGYPLPGRPTGSRKRRAQLMMLDRSSGRALNTIDLPEARGREFSLTPAGSSLLVAWSRALDLMR